MTSDEPELLSFSSPKGGVGRTMTAANSAVIYAGGCPWAGLARKKPLAVDMDFEAPGAHYYDFARVLAEASGGTEAFWYEARGTRFGSLAELLRWMRTQADFGLLAWLKHVLESREIRASLNQFLPETYRSRTPMMSRDLLDAVRNRLLELLANLKPPQRDVLDPHHHIIRVVRASGEVAMGVFPCGEPPQPDYQRNLRAFNWRGFFDNAGYAVLAALYGHLLNDPVRGFDRILLDQNAGETLPSVANRTFAHNRVVVTGFNQQNQDGLEALLHLDDAAEVGDIRIVLSQYAGRQLASDFQAEPISGTVADPVVNQSLFLKEELRRKALLDLLGGYGVPKAHVFLVDFVPDAVQHEHFHKPQSASWNELVRMLISIEKNEAERPAADLSGIREVRLLGEFVGADLQSASGPIGALRSWLRERLADTPVGAIATEHEHLAELAVHGSVPLRMPPAFPSDELIVATQRDGETARTLKLSDFDVVALPAYLLSHVRNDVEVLSLDGIHAYSDDRIGPVDLAYLADSILGLQRYGFSDRGGSEPVAYPLFVDYQVLAVNKDRIIKDDFKRDYFWREQRRFRGFPDPADIVAAARAAKENDVPADRLIMTLEEKHIAQWYEWQTIIALFGGKDFDIAGPWEDPSRHSLLTSNETVRATRFYLELSTYASKDSNTTAWDKATKLFFRDKQVGMAFVFPDAIPLEYRTPVGDSPFIYSRLPQHDVNDESSAPYREECWLLVVPKGRRAGAPPVSDLTQVLTEFLCYQHQLRYQELGGLTPHRRALECVDLWGSSPFLPLLTGSNRDTYAAPRECSPNARNIALRIVEALDGLHRFVESELKRQHTEPTPNDYLWHKDEFVNVVEDMARQRFAEIESSLAAVSAIPTTH